MSILLRVLVRGVVGLVLVGVGVILGGTVAGASEHDVVDGADVRIPVVLDGRTPVGEARVARELTTTGERLVVEVVVPAGFRSTTICVAEAAFTGPVAPARCADRSGPGTSHRFETAIPTGAERHVQIRVGVRGGVAYAGWQDGRPASGSVEVPLLPVREDPALPLPEAQLGASSASLVTVVNALDGGVEDPEDPPLPLPGCGEEEVASETAIAASTGTDGRPAACAGRDEPGRPAGRA